MTKDTSPPLLEMRHVSKTFGNIKALTNINLIVKKGETHALMGENGAGKSTLMKILSGALKADQGSEIFIDGQPIQTGNLAKARALGIAVIYQELSLCPNLTVAQNIYLGHEMANWGLLSKKEMENSILSVIDILGINFNLKEIVGNLSLGEMQMVEIARALAANARIIVMDEPTTSLSSHESEKLFNVIEQLKSNGIAIIYISHRMEEVYRLSDRVSVLRDGQYIGTLEKDEISAERIISMMVGRDLNSFYVKTFHEQSNDVVISVNNISDDRHVFDCSFNIHKGEVLGVSGLVGAGRTEMARLIFGADKKTHGDVVLNGKSLDISRPKEAITSGIAYLTEDRKGLGLFLDMSVSRNINIGVIGYDAYLGGILNSTKEKTRTSEAFVNLNVRAPSASINVRSLSGGNQQKVLLARLLETKPAFIILDEPTRGVDIGAKSEIYKIINELSHNGVAIMVISSDLPELIGIADRIIVMREGRIVGEINASDETPITQEAVMVLSTGSIRSTTQF